MFISKYVQKYEKFILNESLNHSDGIKNEFVFETQSHITKNLIQLLRLEEKDISFVGSAGKGINEEIFSNINVCIDRNKLISENNLDEKEIFEFLEKQFKRLNIKYELDEKNDSVIVSWPIKGEDSNKSVETIIQLSEYLEWVNFSRYSPNLNENKSKFKGKYREALLKAIVESMKQEVIAYFDDKDSVKEFIEYQYDIKKGLFHVTKTFEGKHGIFSKAQILEGSKRIVTNNPEEFIKIIFGDEAKCENLMTFEECFEELKKNKLFSKKRNKILEKFKKNLIGMRLTIPEGLM